MLERGDGASRFDGPAGNTIKAATGGIYNSLAAKRQSTIAESSELPDLYIIKKPSATQWRKAFSCPFISQAHHN